MNERDKVKKKKIKVILWLTGNLNFFLSFTLILLSKIVSPKQ